MPEQFSGKIGPLDPDRKSRDRTASGIIDLCTDKRGGSFDKLPILMGQIASKAQIATLPSGRIVPL